jgi:hypothetical protein
MSKGEYIRTKSVARPHRTTAFNRVAAGTGVPLKPVFSGVGVAHVPTSDFSVSRTLVVRTKPKSKSSAEVILDFLKEKDVRYL